MIDTADLDHVLERTRDRWELARGERIFLTGGSGFVGTWLLATFAYANAALRLGARATVLTRDPAAAARRLGCADDAIGWLRGDGTDFAFPSGTYGYVVHAATTRAFPPDAQRPFGLLDADVRTTQRVLAFARAAGTRRFLFTSSGAVYGRQPPDLERLAEDYAGAPLPTDTAALYGTSKRTSETLCALAAEAWDLGATIARLFAFVGPWLPLHEGYAVGNFIADALAGRPLRISGDGTPWRSYLYAADLAIWLWTILFAGRAGRAYNVGADAPVTIAELARLVARESGEDLPVVVEQTAVPGARAARYLPDVDRARRELGLASWIPVRDGVRRTLTWHRDRGAVPTRSRSR